jgi:hypothetical protein
VSEPFHIIERTAVILAELHARLAMRELGDTDELAALAATIHELEEFIAGGDADDAVEGLDAVAGGLEPEVVDMNDSEGEEPEDAALSESET